MLRPLNGKLSIRRTLAALACAAGLVVCTPTSSFAQPMMPSGGPDGPKPLAPDKVASQIGVDQKLEAQVSPDLTFTDETGKTVRLGDYFGKRPLLLSLVYYECPGLCTMSLNGISRALKPLKFTPGKEFDVLTISFDPREKPELAKAKKDTYVKASGRPESAAGWHFLTGDDANTKKVCEEVGFRYVFDAATQQYAHAAAIMLITPKGKVSRYFYGLEYSTRDIELGLIEASEERIGSVADGAVLLCYSYDPASGKYSLSIMRVLRVAGVLTLVVMAGGIYLMIRGERRGGGPGKGDQTNDSTTSGTASGGVLKPN